MGDANIDFTVDGAGALASITSALSLSNSRLSGDAMDDDCDAPR